MRGGDNDSKWLVWHGLWSDLGYIIGDSGDRFVGMDGKVDDATYCHERICGNWKRLREFFGG